MSSLRQFKCERCRGKDGQPYHLWHERVKDSDPKSKCYTCGNTYEAVPTGEEEGVKICHFTCECKNEFVVQCKMSNTAPCYACCPEEKVSPHSFEKLRKINRETDNSHNCSECDGKGNCPNMKCRPAASGSRGSLVDDGEAAEKEKGREKQCDKQLGG